MPGSLAGTGCARVRNRAKEKKVSLHRRILGKVGPDDRQRCGHGSGPALDTRSGGRADSDRACWVQPRPSLPASSALFGRHCLRHGLIGVLTTWRPSSAPAAPLRGFPPKHPRRVSEALSGLRAERAGSGRRLEIPKLVGRKDGRRRWFCLAFVFDRPLFPKITEAKHAGIATAVIAIVES